MNASTTEIASMPFGTVSLSQSMFLTKWEVEKVTKGVRETRVKRKDKVTLQIADRSQKDPEEVLNTTSIKLRLMVLKSSSELQQPVDLLIILHL